MITTETAWKAAESVCPALPARSAMTIQAPA